MSDHVRQHFDQYARSHRWQDFYERPLAPGNCHFHLRKRAYAGLLDRFRPRNVIDVGCGSGDFLSLFLEGDQRYHGVDFSEEMVKETQRKIDSLPEGVRERFSCTRANVATMSVTERYDFVLASGLLEYFDDMKPVVRQLCALAKKGGVVAAQVPNRELWRWRDRRQTASPEKGFVHHRVSKEECDALFAACGMRKADGLFVNHSFFKDSKERPRLHVWLCENLGPLVHERVSRGRASMYLGVYRR